MIDGINIRNELKKIMMLNENELTSPIHAAVCPEPDKVFKAFKEIDDVRVVIIGQDPYPKPGLATGIAFGINEEDDIPAALNTIMDEIALHTRHDITVDKSNFDVTLMDWVKQGVLLMNSSLTCEPYKPEGLDFLKVTTSHSYYWEKILTPLVSFIDNHDDIVFALFGQKAQAIFTPIIKNNVVLNCAHPTADYYNKKNIFVGSQIFNQINSHLKEPIKW
jgi:uracil-DNA glycosylase